MQPLEEYCLIKANELITKGMVSKHTDVFELTDMLIALETEKIDKNTKSDHNLNYNDPIVSIEDVGEVETTDISTSGDNLFYCNNILTKNSFGLPATADLMIAFIRTEQLDKMNQIMVKQLKNRYNDSSTNKRFTLGIDLAKMRLYDVSDPTANIMADDNISSAPQTPFAAGRSSAGRANKFNDFKI
jgi:hypothetical protein